MEGSEVRLLWLYDIVINLMKGEVNGGGAKGNEVMVYIAEVEVVKCCELRAKKRTKIFKQSARSIVIRLFNKVWIIA